MADKPRNIVQTKVYWKSTSTQDSIAAEMASKIDSLHGQHHCPSTAPSTTGVYSNGDMVDSAIGIAQHFQKRNLELEAQASRVGSRVVVGLRVLCRAAAGGE